MDKIIRTGLQLDEGLHKLAAQNDQNYLRGSPKFPNIIIGRYSKYQKIITTIISEGSSSSASYFSRDSWKTK